MLCLMFDRIIVAVDDSQEAQRGLKSASRLAAAHDAEILVVHVHEIPVALTMGAPSDASSLVEQSMGRVLVGPGTVAERVLEAACPPGG